MQGARVEGGWVFPLLNSMIVVQLQDLPGDSRDHSKEAGRKGATAAPEFQPMADLGPICLEV